MICCYFQLNIGFAKSSHSVSSCFYTASQLILERRLHCTCGAWSHQSNCLLLEPNEMSQPGDSHELIHIRKRLKHLEQEKASKCVCINNRGHGEDVCQNLHSLCFCCNSPFCKITLTLDYPLLSSHPYILDIMRSLRNGCYLGNHSKTSSGQCHDFISLS